MRVVIAPDHFGGPLSSPVASAALAHGWTERGHEVVAVPMSDGGAGLVEAVHAARGGNMVALTLPGGTGGADRPATVLHVPGRSGGTAYAEASVALDGVGTAADPLTLARSGSSAAAADLLVGALGTGARRVVLGVGAVAVHDGGAGFLSRLTELLGESGAGPAPGAAPGLAGLLATPGEPVGGAATTPGAALGARVPALRRALAGTEIIVAAATDIPLLGLHGAGASLSERPGIDAVDAQEIERDVATFAADLEEAAARAADGAATPGPGGSGVGSDLLAGAREHAGHRHVERPAPARRAAYSGAGGGLAFALALLGARVLAGSDVVATEVGLDDRVAEADLVVTGTAVLDGDALHEGVPAAVGNRAMTYGLPVVAIAHEVHVNRRELARVGISAAYPVLDTPLSPSGGSEAGRDAGGTDAWSALRTRGDRVARSWGR
ncbi:glycerate kinase [Occultella gossypii]|uniref:Glycerate kinase n=1 Tax=Occultella gossypii TaxID=2800820 RepID=A0ABS7S8S4_9MICO|nr:glycerate kinase [Occultella gossypii]MBZ2195608.1 glycerate kinase [Occultella gossypii]